MKNNVLVLVLIDSVFSVSEVTRNIITHNPLNGRKISTRNAGNLSERNISREFNSRLNGSNGLKNTIKKKILVDTILKYENSLDLISLYGYDGEQHEVITDDGYIINLFRIPSDGSPVLLQHGLLVATDAWLLRGPGKDLAYILADEGYDIWLSDMRGNAYSRSHMNLTTKNAKYWDFSFHEMGVYDMPAVIDYILQVSSRRALDVIGHSLGATIQFIMCSIRPEYNDKLRSITALAPAVFFGNAENTNSRSFAEQMGSILDYLHKNQRIYEFLPRSRMFQNFLRVFCDPRSTLDAFCDFYFEYVLGFTTTKKHRKSKELLLFGSTGPAGVSYRTVNHLRQCILTEDMRMYNYGKIKNRESYRQDEPPKYDFKKVRTPVILIYSDNDNHVHANDTEIFSHILPNVAANYRINKHVIKHSDFLWSDRAKYVIYDFIVDILRQLEQERPVKR